MCVIVWYCVFVWLNTCVNDEKRLLFFDKHLVWLTNPFESPVCRQLNRVEIAPQSLLMFDSTRLLPGLQYLNQPRKRP